MIKKEEAQTKTAEYEEEFMTFESKKERWLSVNLKAVYYPITGNLYNYMRDPATGGEKVESITLNGNYDYMGQSEKFQVGMAVRKMCFHYMFPAE